MYKNILKFSGLFADPNDIAIKSDSLFRKTKKVRYALRYLRHMEALHRKDIYS